MLLKTATVGGNRKVLVLDSECLRELGAENADEFEVTRRGERIELQPVQHDRAAQVRNLANEVMAEHDETFRKLSK